MKRLLTCTVFALIISCLIPFAGCRHEKTQGAGMHESGTLGKAGMLKARGSYDSAISIYQLALKSAHDAKDYQNWLGAVTGLADCYLAKNSPDSALQVTAEALKFAGSNPDTLTNLYAAILHKQGIIYSSQRNFNLAISTFNRSIAIHSKHAPAADTALALTYNGLGTVYLMQGKTYDAIKQFNLARAVFGQANATGSKDYAFLLQNLGIANTMAGDYENAEKSFLESLQIFKKLLKPDDPMMASLYVNIGRFYQNVRNDAKSLEYLEKAEQLYTQQNLTNSMNAASLFMNTAVTSIYTGDYEKALSYLNKSRDNILAQAPGNVWDLLTVYLNLGYIAERKGNFEEAKNYYLKGLLYGDKLPNSVKVIRGLANISSRLNQMADAEKYHRLALKISTEMYGPDHPETALSMLRYGDFLSSVHNPRAPAYLDKALALYLKSFGPTSIEVATAYNYKGLYENRAKNLQQAIKYMQLSLCAGFPGFRSENIKDNPVISENITNISMLNPLTGKAEALLKLYRTDTANLDYLRFSANTYLTALDMIEKLRSTYQEEESKLSLSENENGTYKNALLAETELYRRTNSPEVLSKIFNLAERSKSSVLLAYLRDMEAKNSVKIPRKTQIQENEIKSQIFFYNKLVYDEKLKSPPDPEKLKLWTGKLFDLNRQQASLIKLIESEYPEYYKLKYDNSVISLENAAQKLQPQQAIIGYSMSDSVLSIIAITQQQKKLFTITTSPQFSADLDTLFRQLSGNTFMNYSRADFRSFSQSAFNLYKILIEPVLPIIRGKELIIVPDGKLAYLSFDVLLTHMPDTTQPNYRRLPYLIRDHSISYAPSVTTYFEKLNVKNKGNNGKVLAFAPDYSAANAVMSQTNESGIRYGKIISNLAYNAAEAQNIGKLFSEKLLTGNKATETAFKQLAPGYKVLHLAMHTMINSENPEFSKLVFFRSNNDTANDGLLNASELINIKLTADMAVLSACNTGSGKLKTGEGVMSIARDFLYAGVPGIVMTLWAVQDKSGVELMDNFYGYIAKGKSRDEALRLAKLDYLQHCDMLTSHPHYWASYVNIGDTSPLHIRSGRATLNYLLGALALAVMSFIIFKILKKR